MWITKTASKKIKLFDYLTPEYFYSFYDEYKGKERRKKCFQQANTGMYVQDCYNNG